MMKVSRKEVKSHQGGMIVGPIPMGVIPEEFVKSQGKGNSFCIHLFKSPKKSNGQYPVVQGSFWILK